MRPFFDTCEMLRRVSEVGMWARLEQNVFVRRHEDDSFELAMRSAFWEGIRELSERELP